MNTLFNKTPHSGQPDFAQLAKDTRQATQATQSGLRIRQHTPGLTRFDVVEAAEQIVNRQITEGLQEAGENAALELAAALADVLDAYAKYFGLLDAVPLNLETAHTYLDARTWASTKPNVQNMLFEEMQKSRCRMMKRVQRESEGMSEILEQVDKCNPEAQERFERRRLYLQGIHNDEQDRRIAKMKATGLIGRAQ